VAATSKPYPAIPEPSSTNGQEVGRALKQTIEVLTKVRGSRTHAAVTFQDLVDLGLITAADIP
jgi:hypothetical protein